MKTKARANIRGRVEALESLQDAKVRQASDGLAEAGLPEAGLPLLRQTLACMEIIANAAGQRPLISEAGAAAIADVQMLREQIRRSVSNPDLERECREFLLTMRRNLQELSAREQGSMTTP